MPRRLSWLWQRAAARREATLIFSDLSWDSAQIQNAIVRQIAEYGYGYTTEAVYGDTIPLFEAINRGDTNITMEIWLPNQAEAWAAALAEGNIQNLGKSLADNCRATSSSRSTRKTRIRAWSASKT